MNFKQKIDLDKHSSKGFLLIKWLMVLVLVLGLSSCNGQAKSQDVPVSKLDQLPPVTEISGTFSETAPPAVIQELRLVLENYQPQVKILSPQADEVLQADTVAVRFQVQDLPIFKNSEWQLGPHLHVILDNEPYMAVYDLSQPLVFSGLSAGTHTLRVFASRPWHESFKNAGAYAQATFHVFTKTNDNNPDPNLPLLTYSRPKDKYGAEPILLDYYLTNAPLHAVAEDNPEDPVSNWRIRCTINGESYIFDRWQSVYLKGFKPGKNWVKLEFLDNQGNPVKNAFNTTARLITYEPNGKDTLSRIIRGELTADEVRGIVEPTYTAKIPVVEPTPLETPPIEAKPTPPQLEEELPKVEVPQAPIPTTSPTPEITPIPTTSPTPEITPIPEAQPTPEITPIPEAQPTPEVTPETTSNPKDLSEPEKQLEVVPFSPELAKQEENQTKPTLVDQ
ncbi:MAG TPA: hypothetical protein VK184_21995 [Nostocaceae cyanobacterium]|nr:hypothetical protein [Nostocaceae cyanobacterium]